MKHIIIFSVLFLLWMSCSTSTDKDWSSGRDAQTSFQEQRYQEQVETLRKQVPEARPNF